MWHYFEWAWSFVGHPDRGLASEEFRRLWRSWGDGTQFGRWDSWSPYVVSLRAWTRCGLFGPLVASTDDEADFLAGIALHAGFVRANLELNVGGNHFLENLKAEPTGLRPAIEAMRTWLGAVLLPDGEVPLFNDCTARLERAAKNADEVVVTASHDGAALSLLTTVAPPGG